MIDPDVTIGSLISVESGLTPKLGSAGLPGMYRIGAWYDSANQPDVLTAGTRATTQSNESGAHLMLQQQVTGVQGGARGLSPFANFGQADRRTATIDQRINL